MKTRNSYEFKKAVAEVSDLINKNDFRNLCINLHNSLINQKSFSVNRETEILDVYSMMISRDIFLENNGVLQDNIFNYIINHCATTDSEGMETFINSFVDKVTPDKRKSCYNFGMAHLCFIKGDYNNSLEFISKIDFVYFDLKYYVRNLQMMNYYELNDFETFVFAFDSYKHFTSKNKNVSEAWNVRTSAFYNTTKKLFNLRNKFDDYEFRKLKEEIVKSSPARRLWLLKKLDMLEQKVSKK